MQSFERPAVFNEIGREPIEQLWMGGFLAEDAEVAWGAYERFAEMSMPDPVHDHACGELIVVRSYLFVQLTASAPVGVKWRCFSCEDLDEAARDQLALLAQVTA